MGEKYDFGGWATKNDLLCSDGRTIKKDAFKDCDGMTVPLVWQHDHSSPENVLGHCLLENREEGVYTYGSFNDTEMGEKAKSLVEHGDIDRLSIYANKLKQKGGDVLHGAIREVSLVLAGANPGALIDTPILEHGDGAELIEDEAIIYTGEPLYVDESLDHADTDTDSSEEEMSAEDEPAEGDLKMADEKNNDERTVQDVFDELTDEQKNVVYFMIGEALKEAGVDTEDEGEGEAAQDAFDDEGEEMKHNVFDEETENRTNTLSHAEMDEIFKDAKKCGSLKEAFLAHADGNEEEEPEITYGIKDIDYLFPAYKNVNNQPDFISRDMGWVSVVMNGVSKTPFSRIRMVHADITADEARALGYFKGNLKKEEFFTLIKRKVDPQTIYKKQKLDRDDILDITDFDVVAFTKTEMRTMLDEEIARALLIGDGRPAMSDDKISEDHIIPIYNDADMYSIKVKVNVAADATPADIAHDFIDACVRARKDYKGSGNPVAFMTEDMLTECLLLEDGIGHKLYKTEAEVATAIRASRIVTVPVMENVTDSTNGDLAAIIVNLSDYKVGADKGGAINMFDDFDIDYNQQKYLMETRCSGALVKPYSAMVVSIKQAS